MNRTIRRVYADWWLRGWITDAEYHRHRRTNP